MSQSKLLLHIGYPKSASTYLQHVLRINNTDMQRRESYVYSRFPNGLNAQIVDSKGQGIFISSDENYLLTPIEDFASAEKAARSDAEKIETFKCHFANKAASLSHRGLTVRILVQHREPKSYVRSLYKEAIRYGRYRHKFGKFLADWGEVLAYTLEFARIEQLIEEAFGAAEIVYVPFELMDRDIRAWRRLIAEFFEGYIKLFISEPVRPSLADETSEYLRRYNAVLDRIVRRTITRYRANGNEIAAADLETFMANYPRLLNLSTGAWPDNARLLNRLLRGFRLKGFSPESDEFTEQQLDALLAPVVRSNTAFQKHSNFLGV